MTWGLAFLLTEAIEVPIYLLGMRGSSESVPWRVAAAFGASAFTHPIVWFVFPELEVGYWTYFWIAESFAFLAEALYLRAFGFPRPVLLSLLANGTSASVGLVIWRLQAG